jgi:biopolymer transport protein ExbB
MRRQLANALGRGDLIAARSCVVASQTVEAQVLAAGLGALPRGAAAVEERMASERQLARLVLEERLSVLRAVGTSAPLVGLLGTLIAIVRALDASREQVSNMLAPAIGEALTSTALGLLVAVPAALLFQFFRRQVASRIGRAEALGREVLSYVKDERRSLAQEAAKMGMSTLGKDRLLDLRAGENTGQHPTPAGVNEH